MTVNWILPMAGKGTRTSKLGECKPAIKIFEKPIFSWCLSGIKKHISSDDLIIAITTEYFESKFRLESLLRKSLVENEILAQVHFITVPNTPNGPADSVFKSKDIVNKKEITIVINPDQYCNFDFPKSSERWDVFMPLYFNNTGKSSYVLIENNKITEVKEKLLISNYASSGIYAFKKGQILFDYLEKTFNKKPHKDEEYFVGPIISEIVSDGYEVLPTSVLSKFDLGDLESILIFQDFLKSIYKLKGIEF